jgi:hypothetical protein
MKTEVQSSKFRVQRHNVRIGALWLVCAFAAGSFSTFGSGGPITPVEDLARRADAIVQGKVASLECTKDSHGQMFTRVELDVTEVWKGSPTNHFSLVHAGGVLGGRWVRVSGGPEFRLGEEVVVFTVRNPQGDAVTMDLAQGKFAITGKGGDQLVSNGPIGGSNAGARYRLPTQLPLPLTELKRRVEGSLR